jgi:hypothetical protein
MNSPTSALPTPYPELNDVLDQLVGSIRVALEGNLVGAYLQGSFALGDFDEHSDVDFIIVLDRGLTAGQVESLQTIHGRIFALECPWAQHLEGSYFPKDILRSMPNQGEHLWYLDHGAQRLIQSDHCNSIVVRWTLRNYGLTLTGPAPESLIEPIPVLLLRREIFATINEWGQEILAKPERYNNRFYQGFIVLNYCRMLRDLIKGDLSSKRTGAEWAKRNLDPSWAGLIDRAWDGRPDPARSVREPADPDDFMGMLAFVRYVIRRSGLVAAGIGLEQ